MQPALLAGHAVVRPDVAHDATLGDDEKRAHAGPDHRMLVHDIMRGPWWTRKTERLLNPVAGKSLVIYLEKPA